MPRRQWLLVLALTVAGCGPKSEGPHLEFDSNCALIARGLPGQTVTLRVPFWNTGSQPLVIRRVQSTCGCSVVGLDRDVVEPDGQAVLTVELHIGSSARGGQVILETNDASRPVVQLPFHSQPVVPLECSDQHVVITVEPGREGPACAEVRIKERPDLAEAYRVQRVGVAEVAGDGWRAEVKRRSSEWVLTVCYTGRLPAVSTRGLLRLEAQTSQGPFSMPIEIVAENASAIFLAPPRVWLHARGANRAESDEVEVASAFVLARRGELPDLTDYQTELPLRVEFERRTTRRGHLRLVVLADRIGELLRASWPQEVGLTFGNRGTAVLTILGPEGTSVAGFSQ